MSDKQKNISNKIKSKTWVIYSLYFYENSDKCYERKKRYESKIIIGKYKSHFHPSYVIKYLTSGKNRESTLKTMDESLRLLFKIIVK